MKHGGNEVTAIRLGGNEVVAAYLGSTLVWTAGERLAGALLSTTAWSGDVSVGRPLVAALDGVSSIEGVAEVARAFSGALVDNATLSGDLSVFEQVVFNAALAALSEVGAGVSVARVLAGLVGSLSAGSGAASIKRVLAAAKSALSTLSGTVRVRRALAGAMGSVSSASAALTVTPSARTFSVVGPCVSNTSSLNFGALSAGSIAAGDLAIFIDYAKSSAAVPASVTPSGFTNVSNANNGVDIRGMISVKKLDGTEGSVSGMVGGNDNNKVGLVFRPSIAFTTITAHDIASEATPGNPASQTCDPTAETSAVLLFGISGSSGGTAAFSTRSPAADASVATADADLLVSYNIFNTSPQSVQVDMNQLNSANWLASLYLTVS